MNKTEQFYLDIEKMKEMFGRWNMSGDCHFSIRFDIWIGDSREEYYREYRVSDEL